MAVDVRMKDALILSRRALHWKWKPGSGRHRLG
jgi:hypothetical protein